MNISFDSTDRSTGDYFLFGLGFIGFMVAVGGIIVASVPTAIAGGAVLLLTVWSFRNSQARQ